MESRPDADKSSRVYNAFKGAPLGPSPTTLKCPLGEGPRGGLKGPLVGGAMPA